MASGASEYSDNGGTGATRRCNSRTARGRRSAAPLTPRMRPPCAASATDQTRTSVRAGDASGVNLAQRADRSGVCRSRSTTEPGPLPASPRAVTRVGGRCGFARRRPQAHAVGLSMPVAPVGLDQHVGLRAAASGIRLFAEDRRRAHRGVMLCDKLASGGRAVRDHRLPVACSCATTVRKLQATGSGIQTMASRSVWT